ncbi:hypothetical protein OKJ48_18340 [Streptomyces kunmingensis]|uniref:Uncharacterized protein n=1 Tax=Streptomyces kunmingensis TaxID=68225 RepID=A0ABU6CEB3_9ACTN|nr:hypothetical protein [Streptomyces kunmingensis]MEB3962195.1 hypothetical protein [Streptomyces kunmingensis]
MEAAAGCLTALAGLGAGLVVWWERAQGRVSRFEQAPDWRVFVIDLPLCTVGGIGVGALAGALVHRLLRARRTAPPGP